MIRKYLPAISIFLIATSWSSQALARYADLGSPVQWNIDNNKVTGKSKVQLVAQSGSMQQAVNFIHRLRKDGKIKIGTDNTYYFRNGRGDQIKIGTTKSGRGRYSNWVILTEIPANSGYSFRVVGNNSYEFLGVTVKGQFTICPGSCPILNAK